jgi:hypothetical protein
MIWLPANLAVEFASTLNDPEDLAGDFRLQTLPALFIHPFCLGIVFEACRRTTSREASSWADLLSAGQASWRRVFAASFTTGVLLLLGFAALVIPGLVLYVRWAFVEIVAMHEGLRSSAARTRSRALVTGRAGPVAAIAFGFVAATVVAAVGYGALVGFAPDLDHFAVAALFDTSFDLIRLLSFAALWALYEEAIAGEPRPPGEPGPPVRR